jgi:hypothetical protein
MAEHLFQLIIGNGSICFIHWPVPPCNLPCADYTEFCTDVKYP